MASPRGRHFFSSGWLAAILMSSLGCVSGFQTEGLPGTADSSSSLSQGTGTGNNGNAGNGSTTVPVTGGGSVVLPNEPDSSSQSIRQRCGYHQVSLSNHRTEIRNVTSTNICAVVNQASAAVGNSIVGYDCSGGNGAPFRPVLQMDDCSYQIQSLPINGVLCLDSGSGTDAPLLQQTCDSTAPTQRWSLKQNADASFSLKTNDGRCVQLMGGTSYSAMHVKTCDDSPAQKFTMPGILDSVILPSASTLPNPTPTVVFDGGSYNRLEPTMVSESAGMTVIGSGNDISWGHPQPGGYIVYPLTVTNAGNYSIQMSYSSWMAGAGTNVYINDHFAGLIALPVTSQDAMDYPDQGAGMAVYENFTFPVKLVAGLNKIKFALPDSGIPYTSRLIFISYDGQELTKANTVSPIAATGVTNLDIGAVDRLYRFVMDTAYGTMAWGHPNSVAHLEYRVKPPRAGKYDIKITYAWPDPGAGWPTEQVRVIVNGYPNINASFVRAGLITLTRLAPNTFVDSDWVTGVDLPDGESRLDFAADGTPTSPFAISGIAIRPSSQ